MSQWPTKLGGNMFGLCKFDPEQPLTLKVQTWSNAFSDGGSVSVDGFDENGKRNSHTFASISIASNRSVVAERAYLQDLVDEFNDDPASNWRSMVNEARASVVAYHEKQAAEHAEKLAQARAGVFA